MTTAISTGKRAAYPAYKPSGVPQLGDVPEHWEVRRLKYIASINDEALPETTDPNYEFSYVDIGNVDAAKGIVATESYRFEDAPSRARRIVRDGDTIVSTVRTYLRAIAPIQGAHGRLIVSTGFAVVRPRKLDPGYLSYALRAPFFVETVVSHSTGVSYPAINAPEIGNICVPIPSLEEQRAIAAFLDRETARIDALIEKKRRQIELLQEKRSALISHAVTKGLNPNAPMKDSGAEWLGRVPAHWTVGNIRRFARMKTGHTPSRTNAEYWQDCTIPWFTLADVWQLRDGRRKYLGETKEKISALGLTNSAAELLPAGTVIFSRTASIGFSGIMPVPMATSQDFWNWICGPSLLPDYLLYLFRSMRQEFEALLMGSTHKTIYQPIAAGITVCVPPVDEQKKIVTYVENETSRIDSLVTKVGESIDKAAEFRTALISAAVTGKIDVRGEVRA